MTDVHLMTAQSAYLMAPEIYKNIRWFFLCAGYGYGKTFSNVTAVLHDIERLQDKKDSSGAGARLIVAGFTLAHLELTFMQYFRNFLNNSKTVWREDTKNHIAYIGTVTVFFLPMENPQNIFGQDVHCLARYLTVIRKRDKIIEEVTIDKVKCGDYVITRKGWKKVTAVLPRGRKQVRRIDAVVCTDDHRIYSPEADDFLSADTFKEGSTVLKTSLGRVKAWEDADTTLGVLKQIQKNLTVLDTIDTQVQSSMGGGCITLIRAAWRIMQLCGVNISVRFLRDMLCIIRTEINLIISLKILRLLQEKSIRLSTTENDGIDRGIRNQSEKRFQRQQKEETENKGKKKFVLFAVKCLWVSIMHNIVLLLAGDRKKELKELLYAKDAEKSLQLLTGELCIVVQDAETLLNMRQEQLITKRLFLRKPVRYAGKSLKRTTRRLRRAAGAAEELSGEEVYDLAVEDVHEFTAEGVLVHNCIYVEEADELTEDKMIEATKSLSQRARQRIIGERSPCIRMASTAQGQKGIYRLLMHYTKSGIAYMLIRGFTEDNHHLPREYVLDMYRQFDATEREVFMHAKFLSVKQGRVFPGFDWKVNFTRNEVPLLPPGARVFIAQDFNQNYNRGSAWVSIDGMMHCVKQYDFTDIAEAPSVYRYDFPEQDIFWVPDASIKGSYIQFARALMAAGVHIIHRSKNPSVEDTCYLVSVLCRLGKIMFYQESESVAEAVSVAHRDKNNLIAKGKGPSDWQHWGDTVRYAVSYMALVLPEYEDIRQSVITRIASLRREVEEGSGNEVKKLGAGYMQIEPSILER